MPRPVRKKQLPSKLDSNLFIIGWKSQLAEQGDKTSISDEMEETRKRSSRLIAKKSKDDNSMDKRNKKVEKCGSPGKNRGIRGRGRNKSIENDFHSSDQTAKHSETDSSSPERKTKSPVPQNKFFKSKIPGGVGSQKIRLTKKVVLQKRANNPKQTRVKDSVEFLPALRQATLSESFKRSSLLNRLRPRKTAKDYKDYSMLVERSISPDKRKSIVLLERIDRSQESDKVPVYKSVKLSEINTEDKESVYEFEFDANDPGEKKNVNRTRKKKRAPRKAAPIKKEKVLSKKDIDMPEKLVESSKNSAATEEDNRGLIGCNHIEKHELPRVGIGNERKNTAGCDYAENELLREQDQNNSRDCDQGEATELAHVGIENDDRNPIKEKVGPENLPLKENVKMENPKPKISSMETLTGDRKVSFKPALSLTRQHSTKVNPFRPTQSIFKPRPTLNPKDMMDHSLLNKSLSPIKNDANNFDVASPWRPPLGNAFFSVKQVVQSTPRISRNIPLSAEFKQTQRIPENDENENITEIEGGKIIPAVKQNDKNRLMNPLSNRILNAENIQANSNASVDVSKIGERKSSGQLLSYGENKQHSGFGDRLYKSPIKSDKAASTSRGSIGSKIKNQELPSAALFSKKQGMRSGIHDNDNENLPPREELRLLKQSNLNSFLNIYDVPESTTINTSHGIFGDSNSTSIVSSKVQMPRLTVENCFGFDDDYSDPPETPVKMAKKKSTTPVKKVFERLKERILPAQAEPVSSSIVKSARISLGEIKNTLRPRKEMKLGNPELKEENKEQKQVIGIVKVSGDKKKDIESKDVPNTAKFCDTFDILSQSEHGNETEKSLSEVGLFVDLEPVHFTQPPRWSYAKKRERTEYWSTEDEENVEDREERPVLKKKKLTKMKKANDKIIDEWVKNVNNTFEEIEQYDLVVEKRS